MPGYKRKARTRRRNTIKKEENEFINIILAILSFICFLLLIIIIYKISKLNIQI